jgi:hypothetical protein
MAENSASDANATRFEYDTLSRKTEEYLCDDLNVAGAEGWEVISITYRKDPGGMGDTMCWTAFLKRAYTGEARTESVHERKHADEIAKKTKFLEARLDDSESEFHFQDEAGEQPAPLGAPAAIEPAAELAEMATDVDELRLEGDDGGLKLEGDGGGLKLEDDGFGEFKLQDDVADAEIIEAEEFLDDEKESKG